MTRHVMNVSRVDFASFSMIRVIEEIEGDLRLTGGSLIFYEDSILGQCCIVFRFR